MAVLTNTITTTDVAPAISVDLVSDISNDIRALQEILDISSLIPMADGSTVNIYTAAVTEAAAQAAEGDEIALSDVTYTGTPKAITLKKWRKLVTAEAIQKSGRERAIYDTDRELINVVRGHIKDDFFTGITAGTGTATAAATFQAQLANNWAALHVGFEDSDINPVHFVNPLDVAGYLGGAAISTQNAFGFDYVRDFLGLGTVIFSAKVTQGDVWSTAKENIRGAFVPANGSLGAEFDLTADETGLVGITHGRRLDRASIETLIMSGAAFFAENLAKVYKGTIAGA